MAAVDRIKYDGPPNVLVWKFPSENIVTGGQLIVNESQQALFFKGGQALDLFDPGTHTLATKNLPLLQKLVNLPFGGQTPFSAEVYYINRVSKLDYKWGTKSPIPIEDPKYKVLLSVGCFGRFGVRVDDSRTFITQVVGTLPSSGGGWDSEKVVEYFRGVITTRVKDTIAKYLVEKDISLASMSAYLDDVSKLAEERIRPEFTKYGLSLLSFFVTTVDIPTEEIKRIQEGGFKRLEVDQIGTEKYQLIRAYDTMEAAAKNPGAVGTLMGAGIGLGVGAQMAAGPMAEIGKKTIGAIGEGQQAAKTKACFKCGSSISVDSRFCSNCGAAADVQSACPSCKATVSPDAKFCGNCGAELRSTRFCKSCGTSLEPGAKFCGKCGEQQSAG